MQALQLTKDQEIKLLNMCKVLFPEYKYFNLHDGTCNLCTSGTLDFSKEENPEWNSWNRINWFEFCMTHLAMKLLIMYDFKLYQTTGNFMYKHPIDYLYTEFLKLKL